MSTSRSVFKDTLAMSMGMDGVLNEINFWESKSKKVKSVKKRLKDYIKQGFHLQKILKSQNN